MRQIVKFPPTPQFCATLCVDEQTIHWQFWHWSLIFCRAGSGMKQQSPLWESFKRGEKTTTKERRGFTCLNWDQDCVHESHLWPNFFLSRCHWRRRQLFLQWWLQLTTSLKNGGIIQGLKDTGLKSHFCAWKSTQIVKNAGGHCCNCIFWCNNRHLCTWCSWLSHFQLSGRVTTAAKQKSLINNWRWHHHHWRCKECHAECSLKMQNVGLRSMITFSGWCSLWMLCLLAQILNAWEKPCEKSQATRRILSHQSVNQRNKLTTGQIKNNWHQNKAIQVFQKLLFLGLCFKPQVVTVLLIWWLHCAWHF